MSTVFYLGLSASAEGCLLESLGDAEGLGKLGAAAAVPLSQDLSVSPERRWVEVTHATSHGLVRQRSGMTGAIAAWRLQ